MIHSFFCNLGGMPAVVWEYIEKGGLVQDWNNKRGVWKI